MSRLGKLHKAQTEEEILELADGYDPYNNEFFFHRQPRNFNCVLNFLQNGKLHLGEETCVIAFSQVRNVYVWLFGLIIGQKVGQKATKVQKKIFVNRLEKIKKNFARPKFFWLSGQMAFFNRFGNQFRQN